MYKDWIEKRNVSKYQLYWHILFTEIAKATSIKLEYIYITNIQQYPLLQLYFINLNFILILGKRKRTSPLWIYEIEIYECRRIRR